MAYEEIRISIYEIPHLVKYQMKVDLLSNFNYFVMFEVTINVFVLALIGLVAAIMGYFLRSGQMMKSLAKIEKLEREVLSNYAQILELEKENTLLENKLQDIKIPVIEMKAITRDEQEAKKKFPDITLRKQLLSKENLRKRIAAGK